jgi:hypothetical protein
MLPSSSPRSPIFPLASCQWHLIAVAWDFGNTLEFRSEVVTKVRDSRTSFRCAGERFKEKHCRERGASKSIELTREAPFPFLNMNQSNSRGHVIHFNVPASHIGNCVATKLTLLSIEYDTMPILSGGTEGRRPHSPGIVFVRR